MTIVLNIIAVIGRVLLVLSPLALVTQEKS